MNLIGIEEDKEFLRLQRKEGRIGFMLGMDDTSYNQDEAVEVEHQKIFQKIN